MQYNLLIFGLVGLFTLALAVSTTSGELPYPLEVMQYTGSLGSYDVQLNGTVQEIYAQMQVLHPDFVPGSPGFAPGFDHKNLTSRAALNKNGIICYPVPGQDWVPCSSWYIEQGINYLNGLGRIWIGAQTCSRISCSYAAAIFLCNDNPYSINPAAVYIASYAQDLLNVCGTANNQPTLASVCGQEFDSDHYNIIVREDADNC